MNISDIFQFDGEFCKPFSDGTYPHAEECLKKTFKAGEIISVHMDNSDTKRAQRTDTKLYKILNGIYGLGELEIALAGTANGGYAEIYNTLTGETQVCYIKKTTGTSTDSLEISAGEVNPLGAISPYGAKRRGSVILSAFIALLLSSDMEVIEHVKRYKSFATADDNSEVFKDVNFADAMSVALCEITSSLYYAMKHDYLLPTSIKKMRLEEISALSKRFTNVFYGSPKLAKVDRIKSKGTKGMFDLNPARTLTAEEEALVPIIPDSFQWEDWHMTVAQEIRDSQQFSEPTNVILLCGDSGSGKSQGASAIAYLLNRPRLVFTCDPDCDEFKIIGSTMPNVNKGRRKKDISCLCREQGLPTFEDVVFDYETSFEKLFGRKPTSADDPTDCYKEIANRVDYSADNADFTYVESEILRALRYGWIVEVQEVSIIKRQSVVVALNSLLDYTNALTLPTGERVNRHKEAIVIMTSNLAYEGCKALQQSVLSRINEIREISLPDAETLAHRAKANTGFKDKVSLKLMSELVVSISTYCKEEEITDGVCGLRELQNWAKKAMLFQFRRTGQMDTFDKDILVGAAFPTIINHCSQSDEERENIITACIGKVFNQDDIAAGRNYYNLGLV